MRHNGSRRVMSRTCKVRMFFYEESQSGKAVCMTDKPNPEIAMRKVWIPKSLIEHTTKFPKVAGQQFQEHELTIPEFVAEQKLLGEFEV